MPPSQLAKPNHAVTRREVGVVKYTELSDCQQP